MKVINLIDQEKSECGYKITTFPDGELHVKFTEELDRKENYRVVCRITNADELFVLMQVANVLKNINVLWDIRILYLMGMRMDRIISFREPFTLKILTEIINNLGAEVVSIFHPHSDRTLYELKPLQLDRCSENLEKLENNIYNPDADKLEAGKTAICYPDKGAYKRYLIDYGFTYKDAVHKPDVITLKKVRDPETGEIKSIDFEHHANENEKWPDYKTITVVDDLCDAGGTFVGAANLLRKTFPYAKINIYVRHLVNVKGITNLSEHFDNVYFTNSYKDWARDIIIPSNVHVIDIVSDLSTADEFDL